MASTSHRSAHAPQLASRPSGAEPGRWRHPRGAPLHAGRGSAAGSCACRAWLSLCSPPSVPPVLPLSDLHPLMPRHLPPSARAFAALAPCPLGARLQLAPHASSPPKSASPRVPELGIARLLAAVLTALDRSILALHQHAHSRSSARLSRPQVPFSATTSSSGAPVIVPALGLRQVRVWAAVSFPSSPCVYSQLCSLLRLA